jgi:hypothetical protein
MRSGRVHLLGCLLSDLEPYLRPSGEAVARFDLATAVYGPPAPEDVATSHRCLAWNRGELKLADPVLGSLQRGCVVYVEGRLQAVSSVAPRHVGGLWPIVVRDVQLVEGLRGRSWGRLEASSSNTVAAR